MRNDRSRSSDLYQTRCPIRSGPPKQSTADLQSSLAADPRPHNSTFGANPFPEVTDLFCRLPLPTFFYRLEATNLGDLLRLWVRTDQKISTAPPFLRAQESIPGTPKVGVLF